MLGLRSNVRKPRPPTTLVPAPRCSCRCLDPAVWSMERCEEVSDSGVVGRLADGCHRLAAPGLETVDGSRGETERNSLLVIVFIYMFHSAFRPAFVHCAGTLCSELPGSCPLRRSPALSRLRSPRRRERRGDLREVNIDRLGFGLRSRCARFCTSPYHAMMYEYSCMCATIQRCSWPPHMERTRITVRPASGRSRCTAQPHSRRHHVDVTQATHHATHPI